MKIPAGDRRALVGIVDRYHVSTSDEDIRERIDRALDCDGARQMIAERFGNDVAGVTKACEDIAVRRHHHNIDVFNGVLTGRKCNAKKA